MKVRERRIVDWTEGEDERDWRRKSRRVMNSINDMTKAHTHTKKIGNLPPGKKY